MTIRLDYELSHGGEQVPMIIVSALFYITALLLLVRFMYRVADGSHAATNMLLLSAVTGYLLIRASVLMYFGVSRQVKTVWDVLATSTYVAVLAYFLLVCARYLNLIREVLRGKSAKFLFHVGIAVSMMFVLLILVVGAVVLAGNSDDVLIATLSVAGVVACSLSGSLLVLFAVKLYRLTRNNMAAGTLTAVRESEHFKPMLSAGILGIYSLVRSWILLGLFDLEKERMSQQLWIAFPMYYFVELIAAWAMLAVLFAPVDVEAGQLLHAPAQVDHLRQLSGGSPTTPRPSRGYPVSPRALKLAASNDTLASVRTASSGAEPHGASDARPADSINR